MRNQHYLIMNVEIVVINLVLLLWDVGLKTIKCTRQHIRKYTNWWKLREYGEMYEIKRKPIK